MKRSLDEIVELLQNFKDLKKVANVMGVENKDISFLEHCFNCLEHYEKDLLIQTYIEKISMRSYAKNSGFSRNFIAKERARLTLLLTKFFILKEEMTA